MTARTGHSRDMSEKRHKKGRPEPWLETTMDPFQVMAHPVRRYLVELLAECEAPAGEMAEMVQHHFGVGWPTVSHHLRILHQGGFARVRDDWPHRLYRLDDRAITRLEARVADLRAKWNRRDGESYFVRVELEEARWPSDRADRPG